MSEGNPGDGAVRDCCYGRNKTEIISMRYRRVRLGERDAHGCGPVVRRSIGRNRRRLGTRKTDRLYRSGAPNDTASILRFDHQGIGQILDAVPTAGQGF